MRLKCIDHNVSLQQILFQQVTIAGFLSTRPFSKAYYVEVPLRDSATHIYQVPTHKMYVCPMLTILV